MKSHEQYLQKGQRQPQPEVTEVLVDYGKALGTRTGFDDPPKGWRLPPRDGRLWCVNYSAPIPTRLFGRIPVIPTQQREMVFGYRLPEEACSLIGETRRPLRGQPVRDEDQLSVAEVKRTACYLSFDLLALPGPKAAVVLRKILDTALAEFGEGLTKSSSLSADARRLAFKTLAQETMAEEARLAQKRELAARDSFVAVGQNHSTSRRSYLEAEIASLEENLAEFSRRITSDSRRLVKYQRELASLDGEEVGEAVDFGQEYDRIRAYPLVYDLAVEDDLVVVTTLPLTTTFGDERIHLGRFAIAIHLNGDVRITNLTRRLWNFDHPHIRDGNPCLGNIQEGISKLIGTYQLAATTQVLIDFLQLVNPKEWVVSVEYWREA